MFSTMELSRNEVWPVTRMYSSMAAALQMFSSEIQRIPLSTPEVHAAMVSTTATITRAICSASPSCRPNRMAKPTFSSTTPIPMDVATPKTVPTRVTMSIVSPMPPRTRLPSSGYRAARMDSGMPQR